MKTLGISCFYHDSAAALIIDGQIVAAMQEERFSRIKHDASFPTQAINFCLSKGGISLAELDAVVFYDKPFLKFERLLETYNNFAPKGLVSFSKSMPIWVQEKLFIKRIIHKELKQFEGYKRNKIKLLFPEHHLSHAASAFYPSPYTEAAILTIDGVGEWATASIGKGYGNAISVLKELHFPQSVGLLYSAFTYYLGFKVNSGEYKLMGLAPYGNHGSADVAKYIDTIKKELVTICDDGSILLNQAYFSYATGLRMVPDAKWEKLFGIARRNPEGTITQAHCNLALAIQLVTEDIVLKMAAEAKRLTGSDTICLAGGVALNCVANGKLAQSGLFSNIFIQPAAGDAGGALGAALAAHYVYLKQERITQQPDAMQGAQLGSAYTNLQVKQELDRLGVVYTELPTNELCKETAKQIAASKVIGWFQGRAEFGPRALGNRSILADPRSEAMQQTLNLKIKFREGFRPFAPAVKTEKAAAYFELNGQSPYMLLTAQVANRKPLPDNFELLNIADKLAFAQSDLPAITHVDGSARVQTVAKETNPLFGQLLDCFEAETGCPVLINTSFNVRGEPPVASPYDAYRCFMQTGMDCLVIGNYLLIKEEQPVWKEQPMPLSTAQINKQWRKDLASILVLTLACGIGYLYYHHWLYYVAALIIGLSSLNHKTAAIVAQTWMLLGKTIGRVTSPMVLGIIYFSILLPMAFIGRLTKGNTHTIPGKGAKTYYHSREHNYAAADMENVW